MAGNSASAARNLLKSDSLNSLRGVVEHCDFAGVAKIADIGLLLEKYPHLQA